MLTEIKQWIIDNFDGEAIATYVIALICLWLAVDAYVSREASLKDIQWFVMFAVWLSTERDWLTRKKG